MSNSGIILRFRRFNITRSDLESILTAPGGEVHQNAQDIADLIAEQARAEAPVQDGYLQAGISASVASPEGGGNNIRFQVYASSIDGGAEREYARYVEEGLGPWGARTPNPFFERAIRKVRAQLG